jgi:hypothetical protein
MQFFSFQVKPLKDETIGGISFHQHIPAVDVSPKLATNEAL